MSEPITLYRDGDEVTGYAPSVADGNDAGGGLDAGTGRKLRRGSVHAAGCAGNLC